MDDCTSASVVSYCDCTPSQAEPSAATAASESNHRCPACNRERFVWKSNLVSSLMTKDDRAVSRLGLALDRRCRPEAEGGASSLDAFASVAVKGSKSLRVGDDGAKKGARSFSSVTASGSETDLRRDRVRVDEMLPLLVVIGRSQSRDPDLYLDHSLRRPPALSPAVEVCDHCIRLGHHKYPFDTSARRDIDLLSVPPPPRLFS